MTKDPANMTKGPAWMTKDKASKAKVKLLLRKVGHGVFNGYELFWIA